MANPRVIRYPVGNNDGRGLLHRTNDPGGAGHYHEGITTLCGKRIARAWVYGRGSEVAAIREWDNDRCPVCWEESAALGGVDGRRQPRVGLGP